MPDLEIPAEDPLIISQDDLREARHLLDESKAPSRKVGLTESLAGLFKDADETTEEPPLTEGEISDLQHLFPVFLEKITSPPQTSSVNPSNIQNGNSASETGGSFDEAIHPVAFAFSDDAFDCE